MKRLPTFLALAFVGTVLIIALSPFARVHLIRKSLADAEAHIAGGRPELAVTTLARTESWRAAYPPLAVRATHIAIRALTHNREFDAAAERADWLRSTQTLGADTPQAPKLWEAVRQTTDSFCFQFLSKRGRTMLPFTWDPWSGYEVMANELAAMDETEALLTLARRAVQMDAASPLEAVLTGTPRRTRDPGNAKNPKRVPPADAGRSDTIERVEQVRQLDAALAEPSATTATRRERDTLLPQIGRTWGIVKVEQAQVFDASAALSGTARTVARLAQGTPVDIQRYLAPGRQTMVLTRAQGDGGGERMLRLADLAIRPGAIESVSAEERKLWGELVRVQTRYTTLKKQHTEKLQTNLPELVRYREAHARYTAFYAKMKELLNKSKQGKGDTHEIRDELRKMNYEQARVNEEYQAAKTRFQEWKTQHADRLTSPELDAARQELAKLRDRIEAASSASR